MANNPPWADKLLNENWDAKRLIAGSELLSIHMLDFVVVGGNQYFSFRDEMPDLWQR
jgi:DNA repair protein RadC